MTVPLTAPLLVIPPDATPTATLAILAKTKRRIIGPQSVKAAAIKAGAFEQLVQLLGAPNPDAAAPEGSAEDPLLAVRTEAASILASLSIPTLSAISTLLAANAYDVVASQLVLALSQRAASTRPEQSKAIEALLRALKALYGDLVKVVGPREWGTDVIGASIDAVERRDAESLWTLVVPADRAKVADEKGKGKGKEGDSTIGTVEGLDVVDLAQLQAKADEVLLRAFADPRPGGAVGPSAPTHASASPPSYVRSELLNRLLLHVLVSPAASGEAERMRQVDLLCGFLAGTVRSPVQREALVHGDEGAQAIATLRELVQIAPDKASADPFPTAMQGGSAAGTDSSNLQRYASFMQSPTPSLRLAAAALCSVLSKQFNRYTGRSKLDSELGGAVTSTLLSLIEHESELRARAAFIFAYHVADEPNMQQRAVAAQCLNVFRALLAENVKQENPYPTPATLEELGRVREGLLLSIATLCATSETHRRAVLDAQLLPLILESFLHPFVGVRAAACHCVRALSRSVSVLRTDMVESEAHSLLVWLLREDENDVVKVTATAAAANLLLEFSPVRNALVEAGCIPRMCQLVIKSSNEALQLNAMWAIKNATYQSSADFKRTVLAHLTWDILARRVFYGTVQLTALARLILYRGVSTSFSLIASPVPSVAEVALGILRNITCVTNNEAITGLRDDEMGEKRLLDLLEDRIAEGAAVGGPGNGSSGAGAPAAERNAVEALYCLNNIATAHEAAQLAIASRTMLLRYLLLFLDRGSLSLRVASLWVLHNLVYRRTGPAGLAHGNGYGHSHGHRSTRRAVPREVVEKLRAMGLEAKLRTLERDPELDVRERVRDLTEALVLS
ncbi:hypothetical protein C6P46_006896 [Rhodotorula mucilaginosa]|uniref:Armadillo repeat-containing protein 8 n=1 Tax=Rhodotorula mucilaginosa TaxID=5537 RepID=A0A9P6VXI0_RHOMI|nr:hypothetical protein C6P46_006896 [Rhodotorula mucilaginosa]